MDSASLKAPRRLHLSLTVTASINLSSPCSIGPRIRRDDSSTCLSTSHRLSQRDGSTYWSKVDYHCLRRRRRVEAPLL